MSLRLKALAVLTLVYSCTGCAVKITQDPRMPGVDDRPVLLTVCVIENLYDYSDNENPVHVEIGDQIEFSTSRLGRLRIRHLPSDGDQSRVWNDGASARVRTAMLVERIDPRDGDNNTRRFVPVGRFKVEVPNRPGHQRFDFLPSKAVDNLQSPIARCNVALGTDEVLIRGVEDDEQRHGGLVHLR